MHPEIAACCRLLGRLNYLMGDYAEALAYQQKAAIMNERCLGVDHPSVITDYVSEAPTIRPYTPRLSYHPTLPISLPHHLLRSFLTRRCHSPHSSPSSVDITDKRSPVYCRFTSPYTALPITRLAVPCRCSIVRGISCCSTLANSTLMSPWLM